MKPANVGGAAVRELRVRILVEADGRILRASVESPPGRPELSTALGRVLQGLVLPPPPAADRLAVREDGLEVVFRR